MQVRHTSSVNFPLQVSLKSVWTDEKKKKTKKKKEKKKETV